MRARALVLLAGLALTAGACAAVDPPPPASPAAAAAPASTPLPVEGYDWMLTLDGEEAQLVWGVPESDDMALGFNCRRGAGRTGVVTLAEEGAEPVIVLESGGDTGRFPAEGEPSLLHEALILTSEAPTSEPVLQRFRRLGWIAQWHGEERAAYAPHPGSEPNIERYFAFCG